MEDLWPRRKQNQNQLAHGPDSRLRAGKLAHPSDVRREVKLFNSNTIPNGAEGRLNGRTQ